MTVLHPVASDDWLAALQRHRNAGESCALVTIVAVEGSSPREGGTKMVVAAPGQTGSIGGGHLEMKAIEIPVGEAAVRAVAEPAAILAATVGGCWLLNDGLIRRLRVLRPLFGLPPRRPQSQPRAASQAPMASRGTW